MRSSSYPGSFSSLLSLDRLSLFGWWRRATMDARLVISLKTGWTWRLSRYLKNDKANLAREAIADLLKFTFNLLLYYPKVRIRLSTTTYQTTVSFRWWIAYPNHRHCHPFQATRRESWGTSGVRNLMDSFLQSWNSTSHYRPLTPNLHLSTHH